jgi:lysozyme
MNYEYAIQVATKFISSPQHEGYAKKLSDGSAQAYWDSKGKIWTIGYGNTYYKNGSPVKEGDIITHSQALDLLNYVVAQKEKAIRPYVKTDNLNENQYATLIDLAYNCGEGLVKNSEVVKLINSGASSDKITDQLKKTCITAKGIYVQNLYDRRVDAVELYLSNVKQLVKKYPGVVIVSGILFFSLIIYFSYRAAKVK